MNIVIVLRGVPSTWLHYNHSIAITILRSDVWYSVITNLSMCFQSTRSHFAMLGFGDFNVGNRKSGICTKLICDFENGLSVSRQQLIKIDFVHFRSYFWTELWYVAAVLAVTALWPMCYCHCESDRPNRQPWQTGQPGLLLQKLIAHAAFWWRWSCIHHTLFSRYVDHVFFGLVACSESLLPWPV
jgi:hypothetical protein